MDVSYGNLLGESREQKATRGSVGNSQSAATGFDKGAVILTESGLDQTALPSLNSSLFIETVTWLWFTRMSKKW